MWFYLLLTNYAFFLKDEHYSGYFLIKNWIIVNRIWHILILKGYNITWKIWSWSNGRRGICTTGHLEPSFGQIFVGGNTLRKLTSVCSILKKRQQHNGINYVNNCIVPYVVSIHSKFNAIQLVFLKIITVALTHYNQVVIW